MSNEDQRKCFTFTWIIENISYCWQEAGMSVNSPRLMIGGIQDSSIQLLLFPKGYKEGYENYIGFFLIRPEGYRRLNLLKIDCELSFWSIDHVILASMKYENVTVFAGSRKFKERNDVFFHNRSAYLSQNKLRARCRIWKTDVGMTEDIQFFARTRICIERVSFLWNIPYFSSRLPGEKYSKQIKSVSEDEVLITFDLFIKYGNSDGEPIHLQLVPNNEKTKYFVLYLTSLNEIIRNQSVCLDNKEAKFFILPFSKKNLLENKNLYFSNNVLAFRGECIFSTGKVLKEIERVVYGSESFPTFEENRHLLDEENSLSTSKRTLNENLKSLFYDNILPDIKLKTSSEVYFAHKSILSARSPVFRAMFSNNMQDTFSNCVNIEDLDNGTVYRMLHYVYTAEVKNIKLEDACELYRAADKYEILTLRDQCSAFIKCNFCRSNVCEALILADIHQGRDLKTAAQDFIFQHDVVNSEELIIFLQTHLKLAADTMLIHIQKMKNKFDPPFPGIVSNTVDTNFASCVRSLPSSSIEANIGRSSFVPPEYDGNIAGTSASSGFAASSVTSQRSRRMMQRLIRRFIRLNDHIPSAVPVLPASDSLPSSFETNVEILSFLSSDGNFAGTSSSSAIDANLGGLRRLITELLRFKTAIEEQSRR